MIFRSVIGASAARDGEVSLASGEGGAGSMLQAPHRLASGKAIAVFAQAGEGAMHSWAGSSESKDSEFGGLGE